ncbi:hypothetical protein BGZ63DRAFT_414125 [Mariannaea sp. PMI_226]|nr:hypothetical protein BGZ63DRAFT_414125 [Mariannaea sp. PMI_226]
MGMQEPLTAQALGRSPYDDDVVEWDQETDAHREPTQEYDHRGRPVNAETKRINRDIVRSHNEVMLVIGVAEQENPNLGPEAESQRRHEAHERAVGMKLVSSAYRCIEAVGIFGLHRARQRILVYKTFSHIPFWDLYRQKWQDFSIPRDILPGAPASLLASYIERYMVTLWSDRIDRIFARRCVHEIWAYARVHLEIYVVLQRLNLIPSSQWFPSLSFFVPFTQDSPIPAPPPPRDLSPQSILQWIGGLFISATPFLVWVMTQRMVRDWKRQLWSLIFPYLPNTCFSARRLPPLPNPPPPPPSSWRATNDERRRPEPHRVRDATDEVSPLRPIDGQIPDTPVEAVRRQSTFSARGDDFASDEEDMEGVSATLISFDVEASDAAEAPAGLWSAELRPSVAPDPNGVQVLYLDTTLTQLPPLMASHLFTEALSRLLIAPYEGIALRLLARTWCVAHGLSVNNIYRASLFSCLNGNAVINFLGSEFLHFSVLSELWGVVMLISMYHHQSEEEWKETEAKAPEWD